MFLIIMLSTAALVAFSYFFFMNRNDNKILAEKSKAESLLLERIFFLLKIRPENWKNKRIFLIPDAMPNVYISKDYTENYKIYKPKVKLTSREQKDLTKFATHIQKYINDIYYKEEVLKNNADIEKSNISFEENVRQVNRLPEPQ